MDNDIINDLKQFIAATVSQEGQQIRDDIKIDINKLTENAIRIEDKIDELSSNVADALEASNSANQEQYDAHDIRISKLETKIA